MSAAIWRIAAALDRALCWLIFEWKPPMWFAVAWFVLSLAVIGHWDVM